MTAIAASFSSRGLKVSSMKVFVIDIARCNGCHNCQIACKDEHCDNVWLPYAEQQPETGQFWMQVKETVHGDTPKVKLEYTPLVCNHCAAPACLEAAENGAVYQRGDGLVVIDPVKAKGQRQIVDACPYGKIYWNDDLGLPQKCTGCAHLVDDGQPPRCADACPTDALRFGDESEFASEIAQAEVLLPEAGTKPHVYYLNRPKLFVAGTLYDPVPDECIEGACVKLADAQGEVREATTDVFGDFWFKELEPGVYDLEVCAEGFAPYLQKGIEVAKSLNLGDIALAK